MSLNGFQARVGCVQGVQGLREEMRDIVERSEKMREEHSSLLRQSQVSTGMCAVRTRVRALVKGGSAHVLHFFNRCHAINAC